MIGKKGAIAEGIQMMPRLVIISLIALVVLGGSNVIYSHHINIRTAEAMLMTRQVVDCLAPRGVVDLNLYKENKKIFSICGLGGGEMDRFFINISIRDSGGVEVLRLQEGDSGATWIKDLFDRAEEKSLRGIKTSEMGSFSGRYNILFSDKKEGEIITEVFVREEK